MPEPGQPSGESTPRGKMQSSVRKLVKAWRTGEPVSRRTVVAGGAAAIAGAGAAAALARDSSGVGDVIKTVLMHEPYDYQKFYDTVVLPAHERGIRYIKLKIIDLSDPTKNDIWIPNSGRVLLSGRRPQTAGILGNSMRMQIVTNETYTHDVAKAEKHEVAVICSADYKPIGLLSRRDAGYGVTEKPLKDLTDTQVDVSTGLKKVRIFEAPRELSQKEAEDMDRNGFRVFIFKADRRGSIKGLLPSIEYYTGPDPFNEPIDIITEPRVAANDRDSGHRQPIKDTFQKQEGEDTDRLRKRIEQEFQIDLIEPGESIGRARFEFSWINISQWDYSRMRRLQFFLKNLPPSFYQPQFNNSHTPSESGDPEDLKLKIALGSFTQDSTIAGFISVDSNPRNDVGNVVVFMTDEFTKFSQSYDIAEQLTVHELAHNVTLDRISELRKKICDPIGIDSEESLRTLFSQDINDSGFSSFDKYVVEYGGSNFHEFFAVISQFYYRGKEKFLETYTPYIGSEKAQDLYSKVKDLIYEGREY